MRHAWDLRAGRQAGSASEKVRTSRKVNWEGPVFNTISRSLSRRTTCWNVPKKFGGGCLPGGGGGLDGLWAERIIGREGQEEERVRKAKQQSSGSQGKNWNFRMAPMQLYQNNKRDRGDPKGRQEENPNFKWKAQAPVMRLAIRSLRGKGKSPRLQS